MIGSLRGTVAERMPPSVVLVEVQGVGYRCTVTPATWAELEPGVTTFLHVHHHIREDAQTLFGFVSRNERDMFDVLVATHGIGPSMAMSILSVLTPTALASVVASGDTVALTAVPGVGKKTAERLMVELRSRIDVDAIRPIDGDSSVPSAAAEVREALASLGYSPDEIREAMRQIDASAGSPSMLRDALAVLGVRRAG